MLVYKKRKNCKMCPRFSECKFYQEAMRLLG